ncbi:hypothetical protein FS763_03445 [Agrobacterium vitis]|uniref:hypothetical protein n=1 Tax=Allorhizobium ampelinum TaxID=3025782 RepID=UPI001F410788|nr:hypothetical protein [Allorhizobium ampelinum]MCF1470983.1 hypothetical protein [Allorhizobium ampelinum]
MADRVPTIDEIDSREKLEAYLRTRPVEEAQVLALRSSLRVMPIISAALNSSSIDLNLKKRLAYDIYRTNFKSWIALRYKSHEIITPTAISLSSISFRAARNVGFAASSTSVVADKNSSIEYAAEMGAGAIYCAVNSYMDIDTNLIWDVTRYDLYQMRDKGAAFVFSRSIWDIRSTSVQVRELDAKFKNEISNLGRFWDSVFLDWYSYIQSGEYDYLYDGYDSESNLLGIAHEANEFWERDPDEVMKDISERLRVEENLSEATVSSPPEPEPGPGPHYDIIDGKLGIVASPPHSDEVNTQTKLFERLCRDIDRLVSAAHKIDNSHPNLAFSIREYAALLDTSLDALDVTGIWAVGGSLAGFAQSFREQNRNRTLAEPLEPEVDGLLQSVVRQHGAFIMGFEEGRDLVDRADQFALDSEKFHGLEESGNPLIAELASNADLVSDDARAVHKSVSDVLHDVGWTIARNCYTGFLTIRNAVRIIIKVVLGNDPNAFAFFGGVSAISTICGDPNVDFLRAAVPFLQANTQNLLAFFQHSPEMHSYIKWVLHIVRNETK